MNKLITKQCTNCGLTLPIESFQPYRRNSRPSECTKCSNERSRQLRTQPAYTIWNYIVSKSNKQKIPRDAAVFSSYDNFWNAFKTLWCETQNKYPNFELTVKRNDQSKGYFLSNLKVVPRSIKEPVVSNKKQQITNSIDKLQKTVFRPAVDSTPQAKDLPGLKANEVPVVVLNAFAKAYNLSVKQIKDRLSKGWSLELIEQVGDNSVLAETIDKSFNK